MSSPATNTTRSATSVLLDGYYEGHLSIQEILLGIFEQGRIIASRLEQTANAIVGYPITEGPIGDTDIDSYSPLPTVLHALAYEQRRASQALNAIETTAPPRGPRAGICVDECSARSPEQAQPQPQPQPQCMAQGRRRR